MPWQVHLIIPHIHTQHTLELKPISNSFQTAAAIFLPDKGDDLGFNGRELNDNHGNTPQIDLCSKFPLTSCPTNSKCSKCPTGNKFKLNGCNEGFKLSAGTCVAKSCAEINSAYRADVPVNQVCSTVSTYGKTCYQTCKAIDFSGHPITTCPANATYSDHPDCATTSTKKGNCSPIKKKVTTCTLPAQKLNSDASGCVNKDDTCPATYFKTCDTGTTGTAQYTELGTACYQCKPKAMSEEIGDILYSDMTISSNIISGKTPIGVVFDKDKKLAIVLKDNGEFELWKDTPLFLYYYSLIFDYPDLRTGQKSYLSLEADVLPTYGRINTDMATSIYSSYLDKFPALQSISRYKTSGTKAGDWFLPNYWELKSILEKTDILNLSLKKTKGDELQDVDYKSSTEQYDLRFIKDWNRVVATTFPTEKDKVRPAIDFNTYSCSRTGYAGGNGNIYDGKYLSCKCSSGFVWDYGTKKCEQNSLKIGDFLYADKTTGNSMINGKKIIGVVFDVENRLAVMIVNSWMSSAWTNKKFDVPGVDEISADGKTNSHKIWAYCQTKGFECSLFSPQINMSMAFVPNIEWFVPSGQQLMGLYNNKEIIDKSRAKLRINEKVFSNHYIFSSNEYNSEYAMCLDPSGVMTTCYKTLAIWHNIYNRFLTTRKPILIDGFFYIFRKWRRMYDKQPLNMGSKSSLSNN